jgi:hypothetical protein
MDKEKKIPENRYEFVGRKDDIREFWSRKRKNINRNVDNINTVHKETYATIMEQNNCGDQSKETEGRSGSSKGNYMIRCERRWES